MTEPTDKELEAFAVEEQFLLFCDVDEFTQIARAVLARWGQPSGAGEPVAWWIPKAEQFCLADKSGDRPFAKAWEPLYATPQPTQAQAGAVPLTCEWTHNDDDSSWDTECGQSWRFDDGGPKENHMNFCHCCGKPLRIKGGQHG